MKDTKTLRDYIADYEAEMKALETTIRDAALRQGGFLKCRGTRELSEAQATMFFPEMAKLIHEHKSFMDKNGFFEEVRDDIDQKLKRAKSRIEGELAALPGIPKETLDKLTNELFAKLRKIMERCLTTPVNKMPTHVHEVVCINPRSYPWKKREDDLIRNIISLYKDYTPLQRNGKIMILPVAENLSQIFNACGVSNNGIQALKRRIEVILTKI